MQKLVVKLNSLDYNKQTPMQAVSSLQGVVGLEFNIKDSKITIVGGENMDAVVVMKKLRKWLPKIETLGPLKEEKKPAPTPAADANKKVKPLTEEEQMAIFLAHQANMNYHSHYAQPYYVHNYSENPNNTCVIC